MKRVRKPKLIIIQEEYFQDRLEQFFANEYRLRELFGFQPLQVHRIALLWIFWQERAK
jgi:hypothetical protein